MDGRTLSHDAVADDLPAYVLGVLAAEERARVAAHLATCGRCQDEQRRLEATLGALGTAVPQVAPPPALRRRLLAALDAPSPRAAPTRVTPRWARAGLAVAAMLVLALAGWLAVLTRDLAGTRGDLAALQRQQEQAGAILADGAHSIRLAADGAPQAYGMLYLGSPAQQALLVVEQLPPTQPGRVYQIWLTQADGTRVSGGLFTTDADGTASVMLQAPAPLGQYRSLGITDEPGPHGSRWPTGSRVVGCSLSG